MLHTGRVLERIKIGGATVVALLTVVVASPTPLLAHGEGTAIYVKDQRSGQYLVTVWVDMPAEADLGREPVEVSVQVIDASTNTPVTDASVVVVAGLRDEETGELSRVGPYLASGSLHSNVGLYGALLPMKDPGLWTVLVSVSREDDLSGGSEVHFHLPVGPGSHSFLGNTLALGAGVGLIVALAMAALMVRHQKQSRSGERVQNGYFGPSPGSMRKSRFKPLLHPSRPQRG